MIAEPNVLYSAGGSTPDAQSDPVGTGSPEDALVGGGVALIAPAGPGVLELEGEGQVSATDLRTRSEPVLHRSVRSSAGGRLPG